MAMDEAGDRRDEEELYELASRRDAESARGPRPHVQGIERAPAGSGQSSKPRRAATTRLWSPRCGTGVNWSSTTYTSVLICRSAGASYWRGSSSVARTFGVSNRSGTSGPGSPPPRTGQRSPSRCSRRSHRRGSRPPGPRWLMNSTDARPPVPRRTPPASALSSRPPARASGPRSEEAECALRC
jgi:hypothetical protein